MPRSSVAVVVAVALLPFVVVCVQNSGSASVPGAADAMTWTTAANMSMTIVRRCLDRANSTECFRGKLLRALDMAIRDGGDWHINDYVTLGRNPEYANTSKDSIADGRDGRTDYEDTSITGKLNELMRSRRVQFQTNLMPTTEGRRKKHGGKHGGMMMMSGVAMAALYAQVVLGKITMLAAAAFVLAKIALLVATTTSLKKHAGSSSGGTTEHIVYADHAGGHGDGYRRNTFRSMGQYAAVAPPYPYEASDELKDRDIRLLEGLQ